ncbi:MAG: TolC family protein [Candidatus Omnitrophica bacterium]|nr:TolC family protein [Candidatus Omnitrophota bacterium]MCM8832190.1 TolC family protein [Candidatus Omnitrophota bacterium]
MVKKIFYLFLVNIFILSNSILYSDELLSLDSLLKEAIKSNPDILAAKKRWEASLARIPQARSLDNPTVSFSFMKIQKGTLKLDKTLPEDRMLSINQMFSFLGKLSLKGKIALVESQIAACEYKNKELEVINNIKNAYYELFMNYKEIELNQESLKLLEGIAKIAEARYIVGEIPQEEVFKINLEIARLSTHITNLKQENKLKQTHINTLLNRDPETPLGIPDLKEDISFEKDIRSLYRLTLLNQPELLIFSYAIEKNKYAKSLALRSFFPDLMAEIGLRGFTSGGIGPWDLMLAFTVPFWFWTKQRYEVKEAIANLEEAKQAYKAMENKAFSQVKDLATRIEISKNKINLYKNNLIPILESSIESSLATFLSGKGDLMVLLDTQRMLIQTKMEYYKALVEYNINLADLERTVGVELSEVKK